MIRHVLNVAIVLCILVICWKLVDLSTSAGPVGDSFAPVLGLDDELALPGVDWNQSERTVLLFASTTCPACRESVPFYRELVAHVTTLSHVRFTVASEEPVSTTQAWLDGAEIRPQDVIQVQFPLSLGFFMTPTLAIVDPNGRVHDIVVGQVPAKIEEQLLARMQGSEDVAPIDNVYASREIDERELELLRHRTALQILDVRPRSTYATGHRPGAYNIPRDELPTRAPIELATDRAIVVDCGVESPPLCRSTALQLRQLLGFADVYVLISSQ